MKYIVLFCLVLLALGFRHSHKSQYDLGYEAGLRAADQDAETCPGWFFWLCTNGGYCISNFEECEKECGDGTCA